MKMHCLSFRGISKLFVLSCSIVYGHHFVYAQEQVQNAKENSDYTVEKQSHGQQIVAGNDIPDKLSGNQLTDLKFNSLAKIPASLISLGGKAANYALIVEKMLHKLTVYKSTFRGDYEVVKIYQAITGKKQGDKKYVGDKRTPEGVYFITGKITGGKLPPKYGPGALTLDYPNIFDQRLSKTGYGIWIHGVEDDTRVLKPFDTDGCVALRNQDWIDLEKYITLFETPVIITKEMSFLNSSESLVETKNQIINILDAWKKAWESSDLNAYLAFYSDSFHTLGKNKKQWQNYKTSISYNRKGKINIEISDPKIVAFEDQLFVSFLQRYQAPDKVDFGRKFLYFKKENNQFKIISEKWYEETQNPDLLSALIRSNNELK